MININTKPLSGFMELKPAEQILFNKMKSIIEENYKLFGFIPMDNPLIERKEVLFAKAGGETETQIYELKKGDSELALRFDLTVPLARYVADKYGELTFPFKRYQIAKVYRGERPQAGRFREFYQADIDVIGDEALDLSFDSEIPAIIVKVFRDLDLGDITVRINNRKIFNGLFLDLILEKDAKSIMQSIDKLDKIGEEEVKKELDKLGIEEEKVNKIFEFLNLKGTDEEILKGLSGLNIENEIFNEGINELEIVINNLKSLKIDEKYFEIDLAIARGLAYYTGTVYETRLNQYPEIGSVCSGGRYDDLASDYTNRKLPGVGISIGLSRLFDQLIKKGIIETKESTYSEILVLPLEESAKEKSLELVSLLRQNNISSEVDLNFSRKFEKRIKYADKLGIPFVIFIGEKELKENKFTLKNMETGDQQMVTFEEIVQLI